MPELHTKHPSSEKLADFGLGCLSEADSQVIELHLADCEECRKKLDDIPADSFVSLVQASASDTQAGASGSSSDTDSSFLSKESVPPLYKKVAEIIAGKQPIQPAPKDIPAAVGEPKSGFSMPKELEG